MHMVTIASTLWYHYLYNGTITFYHDLTFCCRNILIKFLNKILIKILIKLLTSAQVAISMYDTSLVYVSVADILCHAMHTSANIVYCTIACCFQYYMSWYIVRSATVIDTPYIMFCSIVYNYIIYYMLCPVASLNVNIIEERRSMNISLLL
jgi:hypothetical protein